MKNTIAKGFTLIELIIAIMIIGILSAIAFPIYQKYVIHTQLTRAVSELDLVRSTIEGLLLNGALPTTNDHRDGYVAPNGQRWEFIGLFGPNSSHPQGQSNLFVATFVNTDNFRNQHFKTLTGILGKNATSTIHGVKIVFSRTVDGDWKCTIEKPASLHWNKRWTPEACSNIINTR